MANKNAGNDPDAALGAIAAAGSAASTSDGSLEQTDKGIKLKNLKFDYEKPSVTVNIRGFETKVATDIFSLTGNKDAAKRADNLAKLLGDELYKQVRTASKNCGLDNESDYLAQQLFLALEADEFDITGADEDGEDGGFNKDVDGQVASETNVAIAETLRPSNLGRIVQLAKSFEAPSGQRGCSVVNALRYGVLNLLARRQAHQI